MEEAKESVLRKRSVWIIFVLVAIITVPYITGLNTSWPWESLDSIFFLTQAPMGLIFFIFTIFPFLSPFLGPYVKILLISLHVLFWFSFGYFLINIKKLSPKAHLIFSRILLAIILLTIGGCTMLGLVAQNF